MRKFLLALVAATTGCSSSSVYTWDDAVTLVSDAYCERYVDCFGTDEAVCQAHVAFHLCLDVPCEDPVTDEVALHAVVCAEAMPTADCGLLYFGGAPTACLEFFNDFPQE